MTAHFHGLVQALEYIFKIIFKNMQITYGPLQNFFFIFMKSLGVPQMQTKATFVFFFF
jgi:hypothetical protein